MEFKNYIERKTGKKLKKLKKDNGGKYVNNELETEMKRYGIVHQKTVPYSPQQNGVVERANRKLIEKAKCMLFDAKLEKFFGQKQ